jgi:Zn-dependent M28 family amino/carboxypeptidase
MDRDVYFLATTAEEMGLLGAEAFADSPPLPLSQIVAAFNLDSVAIAPAGTPLGVVGAGMTRLDAGIAVVAKEQHRKMVSPEWPNSFLKRQDGWALIRHDIPAVMVTSAFGDKARYQHYLDTDYHRPSDVVKPGLELGGRRRMWLSTSRWCIISRTRINGAAARAWWSANKRRVNSCAFHVVH